MQPLTQRFQFLPVNFLLTFARYSIDSQISQTAFGEKMENTIMSFLPFSFYPEAYKLFWKPYLSYITMTWTLMRKAKLCESRDCFVKVETDWQKWIDLNIAARE